MAEIRTCEQYVLDRLQTLETKKQDLREKNHYLTRKCEAQAAELGELRKEIGRVRKIILCVAGTSSCSIKLGNLYEWGDRDDGYTKDDFAYMLTFLGLELEVANKKED